MAFDFPTSPANGDVSNGYTYSTAAGAWLGGPGMAAPTTQQFFDLTGLSQIDILVPSWAKGVQINGSVLFSNANLAQLRVSFDGTTFAAGASDYQNVGGSHATGSGGWANNTLAAGSAISLTLSSDSLTLPQNFNVEMNLLRPNASGYFHSKSYSHTYDSNAVNGYRQHWWSGNPQVALSTALAIKALRVFPGNAGGTFVAGSWLKVTWLGDNAQIPQSNAIAEAPQDGKFYRRRNGLWVPPQAGEVLGGQGARHNTYASVGATPTFITGFSYVAKGTNSIFLINSVISGAVSLVSAVAWCGSYVNGGLQNFGGISAYAVNAYLTPTNVTQFVTTNAPIGTVIPFAVYAWSSAGTLYINGTSGGGASGMCSAINVVEIAT